MEDKNGSLGKVKEKIRQEQATVIKAAVNATLQALESLEKKKEDIQNQIKVLKHDLFDLKDGRLDRIVERRTLNGEIAAYSAFFIDKIPGQQSTSPWYVEYDLKIVTDNNTISCNVNNSLAKTHASGTYKLNDGTIRYL